MRMPAREKSRMSAATRTPTPSEPEDPAFVAAAEIILHAAEDDEGRDAEEIAGLVAIRVGAEAARVMPEREGAMLEVEENAKRGEGDDAAGKNARRQPDVAQVGVERGDVINPGEPGEEEDADSRASSRVDAETVAGS